MCAGKDALLRVRPFIIARRYSYDQQHAASRIAAIRQDITRRTSTRGDAFTMEIADRTTTEPKVAGASLLSKIRMAILERDARDWVIGRIAGFDLTCSVSRNLAGGPFSGHLVLHRTDYVQVIDVRDDLTALGLIARLEYVLDRFGADIEEQTRRAVDPVQRLAGYEPRLGEVFPLQAELDEKLARMAELEADLAK